MLSFDQFAGMGSVHMGCMGSIRNEWTRTGKAISEMGVAGDIQEFRFIEAVFRFSRRPVQIDRVEYAMIPLTFLRTKNTICPITPINESVQAYDDDDMEVMTTLVNVLIKRVRLASESTQITRMSTRRISVVCAVSEYSKQYSCTIYVQRVTRGFAHEYLV